MSKNKGYNSILFLTTLSVYFGLVLVGAPSSVLAQQAALTQRFEIQNEFETEDDLDKKPDEDESLDHYFLIRFDDALNNFVDDLKKLRSQRKYKFNNQEEIIVGSNYTYCANNVVDASSSYVASWISEELERLRKDLDIAGGRDFNQLPGFIETATNKQGNTLCKEFGLEFSVDKTELKVKISFSQDSPQKAAITAQNLSANFSTKAVNAQTVSTKKFYENTRAKADNQYVRIVTRLPRGSLDALVKSEKQAN